MTDTGFQDGPSPPADSGPAVSNQADRQAATPALARNDEFRMLADNLPTLCWMAQPDGHIDWFNRRWYEYTGTSPEDQEGWGWESVHDPAVLPTVVERWTRSLETGTEFEMTFPLRGGDGRFRLFLTRIVPIRDEHGTIFRWFGTNTEIDALMRTEAELCARTAELETLLSSAPIGLATFDREHRYIRINAELAATNALSMEEHLGRTAGEIDPPNAPLVEALINRVFDTGEAVRNVEISASNPRADGVERHWLTGFYPVRGVTGEVESVGAWAVDISDRKAAEQREHLLAREVDHRAKNLLAVVQSIVQLTPASDPETLKGSIVGRIQALARAHSLLSDARWEGVALGQLVADELAPFASGDRIKAAGPSFTLRPPAAQSLGLVLHELATNAAKYGSLSQPGGRLDIAWDRGRDPAGEFVELRWKEIGGPPTVEPAELGFGSNIIRASVNRQLRGKVTKQWLPGGLVCTLRIPAHEVLSGISPGNEA
jgi:PAS domain S-box-containing protein